MDNNIYIWNSFGDLFKFDFRHYELKLLEKIAIEKSVYDPKDKSEYGDEQFDFINHNFIIKNDFIFVWSDIIYSLMISK